MRARPGTNFLYFWSRSERVISARAGIGDSPLASPVMSSRFWQADFRFYFSRLSGEGGGDASRAADLAPALIVLFSFRIGTGARGRPR